jgi:cobalt/nickel transport protein
MKKAYISIIALVLFSLAVLLPFASSSPDGLEKVTSTFGAQQQTQIWQGLMPDYSVSLIGNGYISTLLAGVFGVCIVAVASLLLGKVISKNQAKNLSA